MNRPRIRLRVTAAAEARVRAGHPWLFANSIREQNREGKPGELAIVYDHNDKFLAIGLFDPHSPIRVRVLQAGNAATIDADWWSRQLDAALARREQISDQLTTGLRLVHGESDGFPGLVLDRYEQTLVLKLYTAAWLPHLTEICRLIQQRLHPERLVLRLSRNVQESSSPSRCWDGSFVSGSPVVGPVIFRESGLRFEADVVRGQKTGFFLDQRENRRQVEALARGRTTLNAFSFSGGFSVYAARGGARSVTDLDISAHALTAADRNFRLNLAVPGIAECPREQIQADAFAWLGANSGRRFDLIILDPPSLAKRESERPGAIRAYTRLAQLALPHLSRHGILVACSCSAHVTKMEFFAAARKAVARSQRGFRELLTTGQPPDHPAIFPEAEYLKAIYLQGR